MSASFIHTQSGPVSAAILADTIEFNTLNIDTPPVLGGAGVAVEARVCWYAAYTCANHEKRVAHQLKARSVEHFLPLYESIRRWKDRTIKLAMPLFPGYVFVRLALQNRLPVLQIPGLAKLVGFNGMATALPDDEIEGLKKGLTSGVRVEPHPFLTVGRRVRIPSGPFAGLEGIVKRKRNNLRVVISLEIIQRSVAVDIDACDIVPCGP